MKAALKAANDNNVVFFPPNVSTEVQEFPRKDFIAKAAFFLNTKPATMPLSALWKLVAEALQDPEFCDLVLKNLRKEKTCVQDDVQESAVEIQAAKQRMRDALRRPMTVVATPEKGEDRKALVAEMENYQRTTCGFISPDFTLRSRNLAAAWRWLLVETITKLQYYRDLLGRTSPDWSTVVIKIRCLQQYINAVNAILERYYHVPIRYSTSTEAYNRVVDLLDGTSYREYSAMLDNMDETIEMLEQKYGHRAKKILN